MSIFTITVNDQAFAKRSAEADYIANVLAAAAAELQRGRGSVLSGTIKGQSPTGAANASSSTASTPAQFLRPGILASTAARPLPELLRDLTILPAACPSLSIHRSTAFHPSPTIR